MRIERFRIENFRNIRLAECENVPDFMVICGANGCGKSAILEALIALKQHVGSSQGFRFDPSCISSGAEHTDLQMTLSFAEGEREFIRSKLTTELPSTVDIAVRIDKLGKVQMPRTSHEASTLLTVYERGTSYQLGFFEYMDAVRYTKKTALTQFDTSSLTDQTERETLAAPGIEKFVLTKQYLLQKKMQLLEALDVARHSHVELERVADPLAEIKKVFKELFAPMEFYGVGITQSPFEFIIRTPTGDIDIDDLSGGEKEVLSVIVRLDHLAPRGAVILFDEPDAHLHPELQRRYLEALRKFGKGNQMLLTTHSPEMMVAAGSDALYTVRKTPAEDGDNQFRRVTDNEDLHNTLAEVMGSRGLISFNERVVFIEGKDSSLDKQVYEKFYPPERYNVTFVPAGNSSTVRKTAERVNVLLASAVGFQQFYSIVDHDIAREHPDNVGDRLHTLPVYHVENFLLNNGAILAALQDMFATHCPYKTESDIDSALRDIVLASTHLGALAAALLDARRDEFAKQLAGADSERELLDAWQGKPDGESALQDAQDLMTSTLEDGTWKDKCIGRVVLRQLAASVQQKYEILRNVILAKIDTPPTPLQAIMRNILGDLEL